MIINHNLNAMNAHRNMSFNTSNAGKAMEKLSSGLRINRAGDDAAGLAISEKMRGQIRGLDQASRNAQDGISLIQTAEGALNETHSILQRMRELAVQSSNDTNTDKDRGEIQKEIDQLSSEVTRISTDTEFNTKKLLNGSLEARVTVGGANTAEIKGAKIVNDSIANDTYTVQISGTPVAAVGNPSVGATNIATVAITAGQEENVDFGKYELKISDDPNNSGQKLATLTNTTTGKVQQSVNIDPTDDGGTITVGGFTITKGNAANGSENLSNGTFTFDVSATFTATLVNSDTETVASKTFTDHTKTSFEVGGISFDIKADLTDGTDTSVEVQNNAVTFQIGSNEKQTTKLSFSDMSATALNISDVDVTTLENAQAAITTLNTAIETVSAERSKLGANQNRLEHTINNLGTSAENLQAAESRIRDVDMAKEMMNFTKNNILNQAAQAMLAQSKSQPEAVLQLLR